MVESKIINGDFRDYNIPKGLVITDPPYNQGYKYNDYKDRESHGYWSKKTYWKERSK